MLKTIILQNQAVMYSIRKSSRAKRMKLTFRSSGQIIITLPLGIHTKHVEKFLHKNDKWLVGKINKYQENYDFSLAEYSEADYVKHKEEAKRIINQKVLELNKHYNFSINKVCIKNQKTRWGSCSKGNNLNFNFRMLFLPDHLIDYIIVHELCHLKEFNHSYKFWELVSKVVPNHLEVRKELSKLRLS